MKSVQGVVAMLGYTHVGRNTVTYSVIEIGNQILADAVVPKPLIKYLIRSSHIAESSALYVSGKRLIGLQVGGGKTYYHRPNPLVLALATLVSIALIPVLGLGLYTLWLCMRHWGDVSAGARLSAQGAQKVNR